MVIFEKETLHYLSVIVFSPAGPLEPEHFVEIRTESQGGSQLPVRAISFTADDSILLAYSGDTFLQPAFEKLVRCISCFWLFYSVIKPLLLSWILISDGAVLLYADVICRLCGRFFVLPEHSCRPLADWPSSAVMLLGYAAYGCPTPRCF